MVLFPTNSLGMAALLLTLTPLVITSATVVEFDAEMDEGAPEHLATTALPNQEQRGDASRDRVQKSAKPKEGPGTDSTGREKPTKEKDTRQARKVTMQGKDFTTDGIGRPLSFTLQITNHDKKTSFGGSAKVHGGAYFGEEEIIDIPEIPPKTSLSLEHELPCVLHAPSARTSSGASQAVLDALPRSVSFTLLDTHGVQVGETYVQPLSFGRAPFQLSHI